MKPEELKEISRPFITYTGGILPAAIIVRAHTNIRRAIIIFHNHKDSKNKVVV